jgi:hypothetical protein
MMMEVGHNRFSKVYFGGTTNEDGPTSVRGRWPSLAAARQPRSYVYLGGQHFPSLAPFWGCDRIICQIQSLPLGKWQGQEQRKREMKRLLIRAVWILGFSAVEASSAAAVAQEQATQAQSKRAAGLRSPA